MKIVYGLTAIGVVLSILGANATFNIADSTVENLVDDGIEYWALLVGCNEFMNMPSATLPGNDLAALDFYKTLVASDHWQPDHIQVLTGKNATSINILKGLRWLEEMDDEDDICLFYIATHGGPGPDYFPKDEADGMDEWLTTYSTYEWYIPQLGGAITLPYLHRLSDDQINYMLSLLDAQGVCAIIDACYSGGFNDPPYTGVISTCTRKSTCRDYTSQDFTKGFCEDLGESGRVVLMSTTEDQITLTWFFAHCVMKGLQGFGNIREDTIISAEEAFEYGAPKTTEWLLRKYGQLYEPQILDDYEGDLLLTDCNLPPEQADLIGQTTGKTSGMCSFSISSFDPEGDHIRYYIDWGDDSDEWTDFVLSEESVHLQHSWQNPGTYTIWYNNEDEHGVINTFSPVLDHSAITICNEEEEVDQKQTLFFDGADVNDGLFFNRVWLAQSFITQYTTLSRIDLLISTQSYYVGPVLLSIRTNLTGEDLATVTVIPKVIDNWFTERLTWTTFDVPDLDVVWGDTYYLILHNDQTDSLGAWMHVNSDCDFHPDYVEDPYINGNAFISKNYGRNWIEYNKVNDFCFVTYGS